MIETKTHASYTMVIGCGEKGAAWAAKNQTPEQIIISFDTKKLDQMRDPFMIGDVFNLQLKDNSINKIHADFIINGFDRKVSPLEILENPDILNTDNFPTLIREWYVKKLQKSHNLVKSNIKEVSYLLKTAAFREMWRVLAINGSLEILDFAYNIEWIKRNAYKIIQERPLLLKPRMKDITSEDFERSASLEKVINGSTSVQKIVFTKILPTNSDVTKEILDSTIKTN